MIATVLFYLKSLQCIRQTTFVDDRTKVAIFFAGIVPVLYAVSSMQGSHSQNKKIFQSLFLIISILRYPIN
jgi:hypothetical protein